MIDGTTDYSVNKNETIYVHQLEGGSSINRLVALAEVQHTHVNGLVACLDRMFQSLALPKWKDMLVGLCVDGADVNLGQQHGVVSKLREDTLQLIDIHCAAHRLELAIPQVQKKMKW